MFLSVVGGFLDMGAAVMGPAEVSILIIMTPSRITMMTTTFRSTAESNRATSIKSSSSTKKPDTKCEHRGKASSRFGRETTG